LYLTDIQSIESYFDKQRQQQEKGQDMINQIQVLCDTLHADREHLTVAVQEGLQVEIKKGLSM
jgi:phenylpyruvate tautomerase PptA (4-oxalocrotonate tautomerase family)